MKKILVTLVATLALSSFAFAQGNVGSTSTGSKTVTTKKYKKNKKKKAKKPAGDEANKPAEAPAAAPAEAPAPTSETQPK